MGSRSFKEILNEKMGATHPAPQYTESHLDPVGLSYLLGQVGKFEFKTKAPSYKSTHPKSQSINSSINESTFRNTTTNEKNFDSKFESSSVTFTPEKPTRAKGPAHKLNEAQKEAFNYFFNSRLPLETDFTAAELKTSFRKQALLLHPDRGGSPGQFIELKRNFETLNKVFKTVNG